MMVSENVRCRSVPVTIGKRGNWLSVIAKAKTPSQQRNELLDLADKYEGQLRRKLVASINGIKDDIKIAAVAGLIESGASSSEIFNALGLNSADAKLAPALDVLGAAFLAGGIATMAAAAAGIPGGPKIMVRFDSTNPAATEYLRQSAADLVTSISADSLDAIRSTLAGAHGVGDTPTVAARRLRDMIGLTVRQQNAVQNYRYFLETNDYRALARNLNGNDERVVQAGIRNNTLSGGKIDGLVNGYADRLLRQRTQMIAQTESFRAMNAASHESWRQIASRGDVDVNSIRRFWVATNDSHTRDAHLEIPLMNDGGVEMTQPFRSPLGAIMYPGDPDAAAANSINCRCSVVYRFVNVPEFALPPVVAGRSYLPGAVGFNDQSRRAGL